MAHINHQRRVRYSQRVTHHPDPRAHPSIPNRSPINPKPIAHQSQADRPSIPNRSPINPKPIAHQSQTDRAIIIPHYPKNQRIVLGLVGAVRFAAQKRTLRNLIVNLWD